MPINRVMVASLCVFSGWLNIVSADPILLRYEGDVIPDQASPAWLMDPCDPPCNESIEGGHYILQWSQPNDWMIAFHRITEPPQTSPTSLWIEWHFRSNHPKPAHSYTCDAEVSIDFRELHDLVFLYGDAVISFSGDDWVPGLELSEFHTYRFESPDGVSFSFSVDGMVFRESVGDEPDDGYDTLQFRGRGGCSNDWIPNMENAWDFVRYGTISYGEQIVETGPAEGFIDARRHPSLDRFTIRYDSANYVYIDDITVEVLASEPRTSVRADTPDSMTSAAFDSPRGLKSAAHDDIPAVVATRRLDNGPPDVVEIVLDRPISYNATTRFTFDDGAIAQAIEFTYAPGDIDGDGQARLFDFAAFQNCFGSTPLTGLCPILDLNPDSAIDLVDFAALESYLSMP